MRRFLLFLGFSVVFSSAGRFESRNAWAASDAGQYGSDVTDEDGNPDDPQYHKPKDVIEQEGRQDDLGKWMKDIEMLKQDSTKPDPSKKTAQAPDAPTPQGYLNTPKAPPQPSPFQRQQENQGVLDDQDQYEKQAQTGIDQELKAAIKVSKAGNSITHSANGTVEEFYHGLLMGAKNQVYQNGMGLTTLVNTFNIVYDFSKRLMVAFTKVSTDPRGNVSTEQRLSTAYTDDSTGLPDHIQRVTGFQEIDTDINGFKTLVTRTNGQYDSNGNPGFNDINYAAGMITSYDQTTVPYGYTGTQMTAITHFRDGTYDAFGNSLTYIQTVDQPLGEVDITQRLSSNFVRNPNYVDQFTQHVVDVNYTRPQFFLTGYDQYTYDYVMDNGSPLAVNFPPQIQHYTDVTYDNEDRMTGWFRVETTLDDTTMLDVSKYSISSFDQWGNPLTWQTIDTNMYGWLSVTTELETVYNQTNHPILTMQQSESEDGTVSTTTQISDYDSQGFLASQETNTDSIEYQDMYDLLALQNELVAEAGPLFPYGGKGLPVFSGGF